MRPLFLESNMPQMKTVKVKPWSKDQGDYVLINELDFDPKIHAIYEEVEQKEPAKRSTRTVKPTE